MGERKPYRKYTKRRKLAAVMAAEVGGVVMAERETGIPESTIRYWLERPEFAEFRAKTREDLKAEISTVVHLAWTRVGESLHAGTMEPRDMLFAAEKATSLMLLMSGEATARTEVIGSDDQRDRLREALRRVREELDAERSATTGDGGRVGVAVPGENGAAPAEG